MMSQTKTILILGGSYAGVAVTHYLLKHVLPNLSQKQDYKIVLVSTSSQFFCRPASPRALTSEDAFPADKLFVPLATAFAQYDGKPGRVIQLVHGSAVHLDSQSNSVSVWVPADNAHRRIEYHALVIATGATAVSPLLGLSGEHTKTEKAWKELRKKLPAAKKIVISGGGPSGVETAGELGRYLNGKPGWFSGSSSNNNNNKKTDITIVTKSSQILPNFPVALAQKAEAQLAKLGVSVIKNCKIVSVTPPEAGIVNNDGGDLAHVADSVVLTLDNYDSIKADLYIPATGVSPNTGFVDKLLLDPQGYVMVDSTLRVVHGGPRVYAIGHVCSIQPRAIHAIMNQTPVLCENLKRDLLAAESDEKVEDYRELAAETTTSQLVVIAGGGVGMLFGWKIPGFLVWLIKGRDYWVGMTPRLWNGKHYDNAG